MTYSTNNALNWAPTRALQREKVSLRKSCLTNQIDFPIKRNTSPIEELHWYMWLNIKQEH